MTSQLTEDMTTGVSLPQIKNGAGGLTGDSPGILYHQDQLSNSQKNKLTEDTILRENHTSKENEAVKRSRNVSFSEDVSDCANIRNKETNNKEEATDSQSESFVKSDDSGVPYDRGWAWMVDLSCFVLFFVYISHDQWHSVLFIDYLQEFEIKVSVVTIMMSVGSICYCMGTQISTNVLVTRYSIRIVTTIAAVLNVLATLLFAASPNIATFFIINLIKYAVKGVTLIATLILVGLYFKQRRGLATTLGLLGVSTCSMSIPPLIRYLREEYGFRGCFLFMAAIEMHGIAAAMLLRPINSYKQKKVHSDDLAAKDKDESIPLITTNTDDQSELKHLQDIEHLPPDGFVKIPITEADESPSEDPNVKTALLPIIEENDRDNELLSQGNGRGSRKTQASGDAISAAATGGAGNKDRSDQHTNEGRMLNTDIVSDAKDDFRNESNKFQSGKIITEGSFIAHDKELQVTNAEVSSEASFRGRTRSNIETSKLLGSRRISSPQDTSKNPESIVPDPSFRSRTRSYDGTPKRHSFSSRRSLSVDNSMEGSMQVPGGHHISNWSLVTTSTMGSMLNIAHLIEPELDVKTVIPESRGHPCSWVKDLIDVALLKNYLAIMVAAMYILIHIGAFSTVYLPSYAKRVGVSSQNAAVLLTIVGAMDIVGRLGFGFVADLNFVRPHLIISAACMCIGIVTHFVRFFDGFEKLIFFSVMHGLLSGVGLNLTTVMIVDVLGIQHLGKLLSMSSMFNSISFIIQHPVQGAIIEATGNFVTTYNYVGVSFILASLLLLCEPIIRRLQISKENKQELAKIKTAT